MSSILRVGQTLRGRLSSYVLVKELYKASDDGVVYLAKNLQQESCILKCVPRHWRLQNEANILKRFQDTTPNLRPLLDNIEEPASIVLKYLDTDLLSESNKKRLSRSEIKQVARGVLEALVPLHRNRLVHTDIKMDNIFLSYGADGTRFSSVQLGDCGGVVPDDSDFAKDGAPIGTAISRSPEAMLQLHWGTPTDIWSFGNVVLSLLYGGNYHPFNPANDGISFDDKIYLATALSRMYTIFGPFPTSYNDFSDEETKFIINSMNSGPPPRKPFSRVTEKEIPPADRDFLLKIMKLDPRDRPTAEQLLADEWFTEESEDTRSPLNSESVGLEA
ncbi:kinase-like protein [Xylariaceae sp. FL1272]|nr:kinase-like protein [Xylariaceae sp. FL1272]